MWWQVDLGASAPLDSVDIWNRADCCANRLSDVWVITANTPITADSLTEALATPGATAVHVPGQAGRPSQVRLRPDTTGQYVRVQLTSPTNPVSLAEVQIRGWPQR